MMQDRVKPTAIKSGVIESRRTKSCGKLMGGTEPLFGTTTLGDTIRPEFVPALDFTKIREKQQRTNIKEKWHPPPLPSLGRRKSDIANPCFSIPSELQQHLHEANSFSGALPFLDRGVVTTNMYSKYGEKVSSHNLPQSLEETKKTYAASNFQRTTSIGSSVSKKGNRRRLTSERSKSETKLSTITSNLSKSAGAPTDPTNNANINMITPNNSSSSQPPSNKAPPFIKNASYSMAPPPQLPTASRTSLNITKANLNDSVKGVSKKLMNSSRPHGEKTSLAMTLAVANNVVSDAASHPPSGDIHESSTEPQPPQQLESQSSSKVPPRTPSFISTYLGPSYWFAEQLGALNPFVVSRNQTSNVSKRIEIPLVLIPLCNRCGKCMLPLNDHGCSCEVIPLTASKIRWTGYAGLPDNGSTVPVGGGHGIRKTSSWRSNSNPSLLNSNTASSNNASLTAKSRGVTIPLPGPSPPILGTVVMLSDCDPGLTRGDIDKLKSSTLKMVDYVQKFAHCMQAAGIMSDGKSVRRTSAWYRLPSGNSSRASKSEKTIDKNASLGSFIKRRDSWIDICGSSTGIISKLIKKEESCGHSCICQVIESGEMDS